MSEQISATSPTFKIPKDGLTYIEEIETRCTDLISWQIWEGLHVERLRTWMANFTSDTEKYFAACVLDSLIYRSLPQTTTLLTQMFQRTLPDLARLQPTPLGPIDNWQERLNYDYGQDPSIRLVPVVRPTDPPTKSAYYIARLLKREFLVNESLIIHSSEIQTHIDMGAKIFIFFDDFLGTGKQFKKFYDTQALANILNGKYQIYLPLVAHLKGLQHLNSSIANLYTRTVETLDDSHSLFSNKANCFNDEVNTPEAARKFYYELLTQKGINIGGSDRRGFGHLELAYAFSHAVPDNLIFPHDIGHRVKNYILIRNEVSNETRTQASQSRIQA